MNTQRLTGNTILPPLLRPILRRVAVFQVCCTIGFEIIFVLGALSAQRFGDSDRIFGMATTTIFAIGQLVIALPVGRWMDKFGRRPVLFTGSIAETVALLLMGLALLSGSPAWFSLGLLLLGLGSGAAQMAYLIGGDIYPPRRRAEGFALMTTFVSIGIVGGPYLVGLIADAASALNMDPVITPWFCISLVTALASWLMYGLHPEPLEVACNPHIYHGTMEGASEVNVADGPGGRQSLRKLLRQYPISASIGILVCFQGVRMSFVPLLTYILQDRGYSLSLCALMVAAMGIGMVLASFLIGHLGDQWGRKKPLLFAILVGALCGVVLPLISSLALMFILLILLGVAFSTALTMTRVIITDVTGSRERGAAMALNSIAIGIAVVLFPTISSYILSLSGWSAMSWIGIGLMSLAFIQVLFLRERGVGISQEIHLPVDHRKQPPGE